MKFKFKSESTLRRKILAVLRKDGFAVWPMENTVAVGMPDIYGVTPQGDCFWIEIKVGKNIYANDGSAKRQRIWHSAYLANGGKNLFRLHFMSPITGLWRLTTIVDGGQFDDSVKSRCKHTLTRSLAWRI